MIASSDRLVTASPSATVEVPLTCRPDVSFVTVTFGTGRMVVAMIESLVASLSAGDVAYEMIVVDNLHLVHRHRTAIELGLFTAGVTVITPDRNTGFGGGCELGALHATASTIGFLNPDLTFVSGWLEPLLAALAPEDGRRPSIVAPPLLDPDGSIQENGQRLLSSGHTEPNTEPGMADDIDYASAACWLMRRDEHEVLGGFDPAYHPAYFEDVDLAIRARRRGGTTLVPSVPVVHHRGGGTPDAPSPATEQHRALMRRWPRLRWQQPSAARVTDRKPR